MSARARFILAIVAVVVVCAAFFFFAVRSKQQELNRVNEEIVSEENRAIQLNSELARLRELQERAPELQAELAEIRQFVPQRDDVANFIFLVNAAADQSGVEFVEISPELPKPPPEGAPLAEVRMTIAGEGGYFALQDFVRRLYDLDRALRIDGFTMSAQETPATNGGGAGLSVNMTMTARMFYELPAAPGAAVPGTAPGTTTGTAPAPAPTTAP